MVPSHNIYEYKAEKDKNFVCKFMCKVVDIVCYGPYFNIYISNPYTLSYIYTTHRSGLDRFLAAFRFNSSFEAIFFFGCFESFLFVLCLNKINGCLLFTSGVIKRTKTLSLAVLISNILFIVFCALF